MFRRTDLDRRFGQMIFVFNNIISVEELSQTNGVKLQEVDWVTQDQLKTQDQNELPNTVWTGEQKQWR